MQLQQFVTETIEQMGGVVIPVEYALCQVLIPDNYASYFQNKTEIELAFDFEVAQENPNAEFVTFGSYMLEQLLTIVYHRTSSTLRFAEVERLELGNPVKKITDYLIDEPGKKSINKQRNVIGMWAAFWFNITYIADERRESLEQVWVNLLTNEISEEMKLEQNRIIYKQEPQYTYPIPSTIDMSKALEASTEYVKTLAEERKSTISNESVLDKDVKRITNYYTELLAENEKKLNRKGLSEKKKLELNTKKEAIKLEREKQLQEIYNKYNGQIEINLDNGMLYFIPLLEFSVDVEYRGDVKKKILYYNPITKGFFAVN